MSAKTLAEFMDLYNPDGSHPVTEIDGTSDPGHRDTSPFIIVRHGPYAVIVNPLSFADHLCIDLHSFIDGQDAVAGVFGMTDGRKVIFPGTGRTSHGYPAAGGISVLVGRQGTEAIQCEFCGNRLIAGEGDGNLCGPCTTLAADPGKQPGPAPLTTADDVITAVTQAATETAAREIMAGVRSRKLLLAVADQLYIEAAGHSSTWVRREIVREARASRRNPAPAGSAGDSRPALMSQADIPTGQRIPVPSQETAMTAAGKGTRDANGIPIPDGWAVYHNGELVFSCDSDKWDRVGPGIEQVMGDGPAARQAIPASADEHGIRLDGSGLDVQVITAAWNAYRNGTMTWLADRLGRIAAIVPVSVARPRKLGDMTPDERRAAAQRAMAQLGAELTANAPAISAVLDKAAHDEAAADRAADRAAEDAFGTSYAGWVAADRPAHEFGAIRPGATACGTCGYQRGQWPHALPARTINSGGAHWRLLPDGRVQRNDVPPPYNQPSGEWVITGAVTLDNLGHETRRWTLAEVLADPDAIPWKHANGKQRTHLTDIDHGAPRTWMSPAHHVY